MRALRLLSMATRGLRSRAMTREGQTKADMLQSQSIHGNLAKHQVCFAGSSTFTYWRFLERDMAPLACFNAAFGGSMMSDWADWADSLIVAFDPKVLVFYCGTNDLAAGEAPEVVADKFKSFVQYLKQRLLKLKVVYVSVSLTPFQQFLGNDDKVKRCNALVQEFVQTQGEDFAFVDLPSSDARFQTDWSLYINDGLHLNDQGHVLLAKYLLPKVTEFFHSS